ncbi:MAG: hypothetical protein L0229_08395 [Blastocatellia bacterium]|nr:hypothetical protein [Blastocatellia bacterium]
MTAIVIAKTGSEIIVGADSKQTSLDGRELKPICKIIQTDNSFFVCAGFAGNRDWDFLFEKYAQDSLKRGGTLKAISNRFIRYISSDWPKRMDGLTTPDLLFLGNSQNSAMSNFDLVSNTEIAFIGFENGQPAIYKTQFKLKRADLRDPEYLRIYDSIKDKTANNIPSYYVAHQPVGPNRIYPDLYLLGIDPLNEIMNESSDYLIKFGREKSVKMILKKAIKKFPSAVGYPISMVRVKQSYFEWIQKGRCGLALKEI